jgi:class 3 adenylate cyclase/tetratricopeptide (TPR) repeat protein
VAACPVCGKELPGEFAFCPYCAAPLAVASRERRKTVTVLFCDVTGSTALGESTDPEALRALLARYFERMRRIVELHGGTVEKFIGDAVMAVFGVPKAHEDDALRALRAAAEMREAFAELGIDGRIGINTGEVVTGTEERLATGDALNVAARLEQAAEPGEIILGEATLKLVGGAVEAEPMPQLRLKGKAAPVPAHRLLRVLPVREPSHQGVFVGRRGELARLHELWVTVAEGQSCELVTVVAPPGVGKSRLAEEFLRGVDALVVRGRCLPYGEGITYWPVVETLRQLGPPFVNDEVDQALRAILGNDVPATSEQIAWAYRKTLEHVASERPIVVLFDDLQWGEETFLDLVEHVALLTSGASVLLLCMARPELVDRRPTWPAAMHLHPLTDGEIEQLVARRVPGDLREPIVHLAGGVPLFAEQMVSMNAESGGDVVVPDTLQALLAARLDQLDSAERRVLECASIEGEIFHRGAVQSLAQEEPQVTSRLAALVRRELIVPDRSQIPGEDGFRFRHVLIRDAAYEAVAKSVRADLHERFAGWLDSRQPDVLEQDEVVAYHLERASGYLLDLDQVDERAKALKNRARRLLADAGHRALNRGDARGAANLLSRSIALHEPQDPAVTLRLELADALWISGRPPLAARTASKAAEIATVVGDEPGALRAELRAGRLTFDDDLDPAGRARLRTLAEAGRRLFERTADDRGLTQAYWAEAELEAWRGHYAAAFAALERAKLCAHRAGDVHRERLVRIPMVSAQAFGPTPVNDVLGWLDAQGAEVERWEPVLTNTRAMLLAMLGQFDLARETSAAGLARMAELGQYPSAGGLGWMIETLAGNHLGAEHAARRQIELSEQAGFPNPFFSVVLAQILYEQERYAEAEAELARGRDGIASDDPEVVRVSLLDARLLARNGEFERALELARAAVGLTERTDMLNLRADAVCDFADVLQLVGCPAEAATELARALELYERKGNIAMAERTRVRVSELQPS